MSEPTPPGGFPLRAAVTDLAAGDAGVLWAQLYDESWHRDPQSAVQARHMLWNRLLDRAHRREVVFKGIKNGTSEQIEIDPRLLNGSEPDFDADTLKIAGVHYHGVVVFPADVPAHATASEPSQPSLARYGKSGPEPRHSDAFIQEMIRFALRPDGFESRKQLELHMKDWCDGNLGDKRPDDRTVERWVARYCPPEIPAK